MADSSSSPAHNAGPPAPAAPPASGFVAVFGRRLERLDRWADAIGIGRKRLILRTMCLLLTLAGLAMLLGKDLTPPDTLDEYLHPAKTSADEFLIRNLSVDYTLDADAQGHSRASVLETVDGIFGSDSTATGITRYLVAESRGHTVHTTVTSVTDAGGTAVPFTVTRSGDTWKISTDTGARLVGDHRFLIRYVQTELTDHVQDAQNTAFEDSLNWSVTGERWLQGIGGVDVTVRMDKALAAHLTGEPSWGVAWAILGSTASFDRVADDDPLAQPGQAVFHNRVLSTLPPFGTVWVGFHFADGTFMPSDRSLLEWMRLLAPFLPILVGVGLLLLGLLARATVWRNASGRGIVIAESTPQAGVDLMLASHILGRSRRSIVASLLDLAVRGNVRLLRVSPVTDGRVDGGNDGANSPAGRHWYEFEYVHEAALTDADKDLLNAVFGDARIISTKRRPAKRSMRPVRLDVRGGLLRPAFRQLSLRGWRRSLAEGYRRVPNGFVRDLLTWGVIATTALQWGLSRQLAYDGIESQAWLLFWVSVASAAVTFSAFTLAVTRYPLTRKGALAREHLLGLREYIRVAEQLRINFLQSPSGALYTQRRASVEVADLNDPLLAYAILFGLERGWRRELDLASAGALPRGWWLPRDLDRTP
ncbi:DUF2207 domain-containing protein [Cryobacterium sp. MDB1-18-2]|uniref:DUF2207 family protein n=1 Tax=unclassified Cryobacterium TaxID=2649013 RepID=UPI00106B9EFE|nr:MULTISPECIES: DUF2207 domain-containing protein [unclassified Cryobacterium]TFC27783.1 DUF2207 domain-containing protein [Cryobacterium sp. MDB1-18-2]TFC36979.1 DUF2207 domain-containing protein [Cryobacterium sp. MDB1-18-1]